MVRAYSLDLRERVVAAVVLGQTCRAIATTFKVSVASVAAALSDRQRRGLQGWRPAAVRAGRRARVAFGPPCRTAGHHVACARSGACRAWDQGEPLRGLAFFEREGISFKKKPARQRAGSTRRGTAAGATEEVPAPA